jgi:hypothetical protein
VESIWGVKFLINKKIEILWSPHGVHMESMGECKVHKVFNINILGTQWKSCILYVRVITPFNGIVVRLEESRVLMGTARFMLASDRAIQMASMFTVISN